MKGQHLRGHLSKIRSSLRIYEEGLLHGWLFCVYIYWCLICVPVKFQISWKAD